MAEISPPQRAAGRRRLSAAPHLGLGNFLWQAIDAFTPSPRWIRPARPFPTAWGEVFEQPSLGDWGRLAEAYAQRYAGLGVGRQDAVGVFGDFGAKYLLHFLALSRLGAIPVLVNEGMAVHRAAHYLHHVGVVGVITDDLRREPLATAGSDVGFVAVEADIGSAPAVDFEPHQHDAGDAVLITHSSGTTGLPKAVQSNHGPFFYAMARSLELPRDAATRRAVCALPPSHNSAIGATVIAVVNGEELIQMPSQDGAALIEAIREHRPSSVVAFPTTFVDILSLTPSRDDLRSVELWVNLGDSAHEAHIRALMRYGHHFRGSSRAEGSRFVDGRGSSEMGSMLFSTVHSPGRCVGRCVGAPQPGVEAAILDRHGNGLPDGRPGRLGVRSPGLFGGYWNNSNLTAKARLRGYFQTGDLAYRDVDGQYHHLDRLTDGLTTAGVTIHTLVYEEVIMTAVEAVLDCTVIAIESAPGVPHIVCFAIRRPSADDSEDVLQERIRSAVIAQRLWPLAAVRWVRRQDLPVGITGKVLKSQLRQALREALADAVLQEVT